MTPATTPHAAQAARTAQGPQGRALPAARADAPGSAEAFADLLTAACGPGEDAPGQADTTTVEDTAGAAPREAGAAAAQDITAALAGAAARAAGTDASAWDTAQASQAAQASQGSQVAQAARTPVAAQAATIAGASGPATSHKTSPAGRPDGPAALAATDSDDTRLPGSSAAMPETTAGTAAATEATTEAASGAEAATAATPVPGAASAAAAAATPAAAALQARLPGSATPAVAAADDARSAATPAWTSPRNRPNVADAAEPAGTSRQATVRKDPVGEARTASVTPAEAPTVLATALAAQDPRQASDGTPPRPAAESLLQVPALRGEGILPSWMPPALMQRSLPLAAPVHAASLGCAPGDAAFVPGLSTQIAFMADAGIDRAQLHLHPLDLGPIDVALTRHDNGMDILLSAAIPATREELERAAPELRELLAADASGAVAISVAADAGGAGDTRRWGRDPYAPGEGRAGAGEPALPGGTSAAADLPAQAALRPRRGTDTARLLDLYA